MNLFFLLLGLFFVGAIACNKQAGGKKAKGASKDIGEALSFNGLWMVLAGVGFILPTAAWAAPSYNLLIPLYFLILTALTLAKGPLLIMSKVAIFGMITFIIMGSYM